MDWKLELVAMPVTDVDRAKAFYVEKLGFNADMDADRQRRDPVRAVHAARLGLLDRVRSRHHRRRTGIGARHAGRGRRRREGARASSLDRGVEVSEVQEFPWGKFVYLADPDGNAWALQELPPR